MVPGQPESLVTLRIKGDVEDIQRERRTGGARSLMKEKVDLSRYVVDRSKRAIKILTLSHVPDTDQKRAAPLFLENEQFSALIIIRWRQRRGRARGIRGGGGPWAEKGHGIVHQEKNL